MISAQEPQIRQFALAQTIKIQTDSVVVIDSEKTALANKDGLKRRVLEKAKQQQHILSLAEQMTLNYIFFINKDKSAPSFLTKNEWNQVIKAMNDVYPMTETPMWLRETVYKLSRAARSNMNLALAVLQHQPIQESSSSTTTTISTISSPVRLQ
ncbi:unnamed protein product [Absidia cylindrospora]